jgi:nucleotide-binding universal stress UspA family protein
MKTILVPTDFSATATNAVHYAYHLARHEGASLVLMHVFHMPYPSNDSAVPAVDFKQLEKSEQLRMEKFIKRIHKTEGDGVTVSGIVKPGLVSDEVKDYCKEHKVNLVVMGITGGGAMKELFIGSNALRLTESKDCDVLIVPQKAKFKEVSCISLATDLKEVDIEKISDTLKHYCKILKAKAEIIHVKNSFTLPDEKRVEKRKQLIKGLGTVKSSVVEPYDEDTSVAIERHIDLNKSGWVAVVHKEHGFFKGLFHKSLTKQLAFHIDIPVLSISQKKK